MEVGMARDVGEYCRSAQQELALAKAGIISGRTGEELQGERRIARAGKRSHDKRLSVETGNARQHREICQLIGPRIKVALIVGRHAVAAQVDAQAAVGEYQVPLDRIAVSAE